MKGMRLVRLIAIIIGLAVILSGMIFLAIGFKEKDDILDWYGGSDLSDYDAMAATYGFKVDKDTPILIEAVPMSDFGVSMVKYFGSEADNTRLSDLGLTETYTDPSDKEVNIREPILQADIKIFIGMAIVTAGALIFIFSYLIFDKTSFLSGWFPKEEKSSTGLSAHLVSFLSYLTVGLVGLIFFFTEKKSRFVKHNAIQALLYAILMFIAFVAAVMMNMIFSFMFPPIAYLLETIRFAIVSFAFSTVIVAILLSAIGRSFKMPFVGKLSENSSYCD